MGACFSENNNKHIKAQNNQGVNMTTPKTHMKSNPFQPGEQHYLKHRELEAAKGPVQGGRARVELILSLKNVGNTNVDLRTITVGVQISSANNKDLFNVLGTTEPLEQGSSRFLTTYIVDYCFERHQNLKFDILQLNTQKDMIQTTLGRVFGARDHTAEFPFNINGAPSGCVLVASIHAINEEIKNCVISFDVQASFNNYLNSFVLISNSNTGTWTKVCKSAERSGKDARFVFSQLNLNDICLGDNSKEILFSFYDATGTPVGELKTNIDTLGRNEMLPILNSNVQVGTCKIPYTIEKELKFINYIENGMQISVIAGIDFTASNGDTQYASSNHYIMGNEPNHYEQAIRSCGSIVAYYDYDQIFPVFGFGGILPNTSMTNHSFNCTLSPDPNVKGVEGIIDSYKHSVKFVKLDGPTYFAPLVKMMVEHITQQMSSQTSSVYYVLLVLTDGAIHDFDATKDIIYEASKLPLSIVIVGIGNSNEFDRMEQLDGDKVPLTNRKGQKVERDIVQFVVYNNFKGDVNRLAEEVLYEIPGQVERYYKLNKNFKGNK